MKNIFFLFAILLLSVPAFARTDIGVSPPTVLLDHVLKGGYAEGSFDVSGGTDKSESLLVSLKASGPQQSWLNLSESQFVLKSGTAHPVRFTVMPPGNAANGLYNISILVSADSSSSSSSSSVSLVPQVAETIIVNVTGEQTVGLEVQNVSLGNIERGGDLQVVVFGTNTGNVRITPSVELQVLQGNNVVLNSRKDGSELLPTSSRGFSVSFPVQNLSVGDYNATLLVFAGANDTPVFEATKPFRIVETGQLGLSGEMRSLVATAGSTEEQMKIQAVFVNTGNGSVVAQLKGDLSRNGSIAATIQGDEVQVPKGGNATLVAYYAPKQAGAYNITAYVRYSNLQTEAKNAVVIVSEKPAPPAPGANTVLTPPSSGKSDNTMVFAFVILVLAVAALVIYWQHHLGEKAPAEPKGKKAKK
ncbi:MAG: hypothetical protein U0R44_02540 [Candidatus Micrarchaeia archaeon]